MKTSSERPDENPTGEPPPHILHSRFEDGDHLVEVLPFGYRVESTESIYLSKRSLLQSLTGHPTARNWTFERYFKLGRFGHAVDEPVPGAGIIDICGPRIVVPDSALALTVEPSRTRGLMQGGLTIAGEPEPRLGIDLDNRAHEVQKLLFAGFGSRIFSSGYDPQEVLQEVYKGLLARNRGRCPWDARKSSFGHYVHMVCSCVLMNYHRKECRRRSREQVGVTVQGTVGDVSEVADAGAMFRCDREVPEWAIQDLRAHLQSQGRGREGRVAAALIPLARAGYSRMEMALALGVSKAQVSRSMSFLKEQVRVWAAR